MILKLFLGIPKDSIINIVGLMRAPDEIDGEDELFAANEDEVSSFQTTVDLNPQEDQNFVNNAILARSSRLSMLKSFFVKFLISLLVVFLLVLTASAIVLSSINDFNRNISNLNLAGQRRTLTSLIDSSVMDMAYNAQLEATIPAFNQSRYPITNDYLRNLVLTATNNLSRVDDELKFGGM